MLLERTDDGFCIDATLLGELLGVPPPGVQELMRNNEITSACERGEGEHEGQYRLTFFYRNRRARLAIDASGRILKRSIINFGEHALARAKGRAAAREGDEDRHGRGAGGD